MTFQAPWAKGVTFNVFGTLTAVFRRSERRVQGVGVAADNDRIRTREERQVEKHIEDLKAMFVWAPDKICGDDQEFMKEIGLAK